MSSEAGSASAPNGNGASAAESKRTEQVVVLDTLTDARPIVTTGSIDPTAACNHSMQGIQNLLMENGDLLGQALNPSDPASPTVRAQYWNEYHALLEEFDGLVNLPITESRPLIASLRGRLLATQQQLEIDVRQARNADKLRSLQRATQSYGIDSSTFRTEDDYYRAIEQAKGGELATALREAIDEGLRSTQINVMAEIDVESLRRSEQESVNLQRAREVADSLMIGYSETDTSQNILANIRNVDVINAQARTIAFLDDIGVTDDRKAHLRRTYQGIPNPIPKNYDLSDEQRQALDNHRRVTLIGRLSASERRTLDTLRSNRTAFIINARQQIGFPVTDRELHELWVSNIIQERYAEAWFGLKEVVNVSKPDETVLENVARAVYTRGYKPMVREQCAEMELAFAQTIAEELLPFDSYFRAEDVSAVSVNNFIIPNGKSIGITLEQISQNYERNLAGDMSEADVARRIVGSGNREGTVVALSYVGDILTDNVHNTEVTRAEIARSMERAALLMDSAVSSAAGNNLVEESKRITFASRAEEEAKLTIPGKRPTHCGKVVVARAHQGFIAEIFRKRKILEFTSEGANDHLNAEVFSRYRLSDIADLMLSRDRRVARTMSSFFVRSNDGRSKIVLHGERIKEVDDRLGILQAEHDRTKKRRGLTRGIPTRGADRPNLLQEELFRQERVETFREQRRQLLELQEERRVLEDARTLMTSTLFEAVLDASIYGESDFQEEAQLASVFRNLLGQRLGDKRILELRHGLGPILTTIAEGNTEQFLIQQFNMAIDRGEALFEYNPDRFDGFDTETMQDVRTSIEGTMYDPFTRDEDGKIIAINIGMLNEAMIRGDVRPVFEAFNQIGTEERYYDRRQLARIKREEAERAERIALAEGPVDIQESPSRHLNIRVGVLGAVQQIADVWELMKTVAKYAGEMETLGATALDAAQKFYGDVKGLAFRLPMGLLPRTVIDSMRGFSVAATTDPDGEKSAFNERWTTACKHIHTETSAQAAIAYENYRLIGYALGDEVHWVRGVTSSGRRGWVPVPLEKTPGKVALETRAGIRLPEADQITRTKIQQDPSRLMFLEIDRTPDNDPWPLALSLCSPERLGEEANPMWQRWANASMDSQGRILDPDGNPTGEQVPILSETVRLGLQTCGDMGPLLGVRDLTINWERPNDRDTRLHLEILQYARLNVLRRQDGGIILDTNGKPVIFRQEDKKLVISDPTVVAQLDMNDIDRQRLIATLGRDANVLVDIEPSDGYFREIGPDGNYRYQYATSQTVTRVTRALLCNMGSSITVDPHTNLVIGPYGRYDAIVNIAERDAQIRAGIFFEDSHEMRDSGAIDPQESTSWDLVARTTKFVHGMEIQFGPYVGSRLIERLHLLEAFYPTSDIDKLGLNTKLAKVNFNPSTGHLPGPTDTKLKPRQVPFLERGGKKAIASFIPGFLVGSILNPYIINALSMSPTNTFVVPLAVGSLCVLGGIIWTGLRRGIRIQERYQPNLGVMSALIYETAPYTQSWSEKVLGSHQSERPLYTSFEHIALAVRGYFDKSRVYPTVYDFRGELKELKIARNPVGFIEGLLANDRYKLGGLLVGHERYKIELKKFIDKTINFLGGMPNKEGVPMGAGTIQKAEQEAYKDTSQGIGTKLFKTLTSPFTKAFEGGGIAGISVLIVGAQVAITVYAGNSIFLGELVSFLAPSSSGNFILAGINAVLVALPLGILARWKWTADKVTVSQIFGEAWLKMSGRKFDLTKGIGKPNVQPGIGDTLELFNKIDR